MQKLIVLSNRVIIPNEAPSSGSPINSTVPNRKATSAGGLAVALQSALSSMNGVWIGWNGDIVADDTPTTFDTYEHNGVSYITTPLTTIQYQQYYCGYANNRLWPALHDRTDLICASSEDFTAYQQVNRQFAEALQRIAQPDDIIWVHDYHFLSVAKYCRELGMTNRIGFFLHIPFAPLAVWHELTYGATLIEDLSHYDVVGLQTRRDTEMCLSVMSHFLPESQSLPPNIATRSTLSYPLLMPSGHRVHINHYPIGVDAAKIAQVAATATLATSNALLPTSSPSRYRIIAAERIDYSKGILERFAAFTAFLNAYPEYQQQVHLAQIACPSRLDIKAYRQLYEHVATQVQQINTKMTIDNWQPIVYREEPVPHEALMGLFRYSDICWVNSLKDGMNLVAKEYIAAQDPENAGVLLLSKYAGAADQMSAAILVDPNSPTSLINGIHTALTMTKADRQARYRELMQGLVTQDIIQWRTDFLTDLQLDY